MEIANEIAQNPKPDTNVPPKAIIHKNSVYVINKTDTFGKTAKQTRIPTWNTLGRPKKAKIGTVGFNFQTSSLEFWDGTKWIKLQMVKI